MKRNIHKISEFLFKEKSTNDLKGFIAKAVTGTFGLQITNAFLGYVISILLARFLGVKDYGIYAYALAWITLLKVGALLGLSQLVVKNLSIFQTQNTWDLGRGLLLWSNRLVLITSIILGILVACISGFIFPSSPTLSVLWIAMLALPLTTLTNLRQAAMQSFRHVLKGQIPEFLFRPILLVIGFCTLYLFFDRQLTAISAMIIYIIATGISFLIGNVLLERSIPQKLKDSTPKYQTKIWIQTALPMLFIDGMYIINNQADMIMLGTMQEPSAVGIYTVASKASSLISFVLIAFNTSLAPVFASLYVSGDRERLQRVITKSSRLIFLAALPIATGLIVFGYWFLLLFGSEFVAAKTTLTILCLGQLFNAFTGSVAVLLNMTGHQNDTAIGVGTSAVLNIILNATLIPKLGSTGAAIATATSGILWNILLVFLVYKRLKIYATAVGNFKIV